MVFPSVVPSNSTKGKLEGRMLLGVPEKPSLTLKRLGEASSCAQAESFFV